MARLWIMQSQISDVRYSPVIICYDSSSAADVAFGRSISSTCRVLAQFVYSIHRYLIPNSFSIYDHHIHSHNMHPWNELVDSLCTYINEKPQQSTFLMTPVSPLTEYKAHCVDIATAFCSPYVRKSLSAHEDWQASQQRVITPSIISKRLDTTFKQGTQSHDRQVVIHELRVVQYNIQSGLNVDLKKSFYTRLKLEGIAIWCGQENRGKKWNL